MQAKEIIAIEVKNRADIHLHKDGLFWRAYNVSAYQFIKYFKKFKINKRFVKAIQAELAYLGFPEKSLAALLEEAEKSNYEVRKSELHIHISGLPAIMGNDYSEWFEKIPLARKNSTSVCEKGKYEEVIHEIRSFPLLEKSPLETQSFLLSIQKTINGIT